MSTSEASKWLQAGIAALKAGNRAKAKTLLLQVVDVDEQNEQAWLWLSGAVNSKEERRLCLENVLSINPDNQLAQKGLRKLGIDPHNLFAESEADQGVEADEETAVPPHPDSTDNVKIVHREYTPLSPAAAILYPDRQVKEWEWRDPTPDYKPSNVGFAADTKYNDVWSQNVDICAYCAAPIEKEDERCPQCRRNLMINHFRFPTPSSSLHIFWVVLFGIAFISLAQVIINIVFDRSILSAILNGILVVVFTILAIGVYFRQIWAYTATLIMLILMLVTAVIQYLFLPEITGSLLAGFDPAIANFLNTLTGGITGFIRVFRLIAVIIALIIAAFLVSPDFARVRMKQLAVLGERMSTAPDFHTSAKQAARTGLWATAVLHWQRAAAQEPTNLLYQMHLGQTYAQLGFYQRSLDVLQSARNRATHPDKQAELDQVIKSVQQKMTTMQTS